jgi:signal peptidase I
MMIQLRKGNGTIKNDRGGAAVWGFDKKKVKEWVEAIIIAGMIASVLFFICWPLEIDGRSMEPTLLSGDRVLISRLWVRAVPPQRGEIVLLNITSENGEEPIIKRVIGQPNDRVIIENGVVFINGTEIDEAYIKEADTSGAIDLTLGSDEYFVMGDHRTVSADSRTLGIIRSNKIIGKVFCRFYPFDRIGGI